MAIRAKAMWLGGMVKRISKENSYQTDTSTAALFFLIILYSQGDRKHKVNEGTRNVGQWKPPIPHVSQVMSKDVQ